LFIVADPRANVLLVSRGSFVERTRNGEIERIDLSKNELGGRVSWFLNQNVMCFAECLIAYKLLRGAFEKARYDFGIPAVREAVATFRSALITADDQAISDEDNYWARILNDVDIW
jgi:hypothetical protein